jgi:hypothetical protein
MVDFGFPIHGCIWISIILLTDVMEGRGGGGGGGGAGRGGGGGGELRIMVVFVVNPLNASFDVIFGRFCFGSVCFGCFAFWEVWVLLD